MTSLEIAKALEETALLLELSGENPFKVRAYATAARVVEGITADLQELIAADGLIAFKGIGRAMADHIAELASTGTIAEYAGLRASIPPGVFEMLAIPGLGPRKVRHLWKARDIKGIGELEVLCSRGLLAGEPGFGEKTQQKILEGIAMLKRFSGRHRLDEALHEAGALLRQVAAWPEVARCEIAGSIRRRRETIRDIDLLVATAKPEAVMERFLHLPGIEKVLGSGPTKSSAMLACGMQCDLRAVSEAQYPFALHSFTGSKEHNVRLRGLARDRGLRLNEYGLFPEGAEDSLPCADEAAIFAAFGLDFIPPELREDAGEIEAAAAHRLPVLVEERDLRGILHAHSTYTDGAASIEEMAAATRALGYEYLAICDHSQAVRIAGGMTPAEVQRQHEEIDRLNRGLEGFRILKGIEVDILADGSLDFDDELLAAFDVVIAAIHSGFAMPEAEMTRRIVRAVRNPHVDILAHPTGRLLLSRDGYAVDLAAVIDAAADAGTALEINAHPQRLDLDWRWCRRAKERGVRLSINPDAHAVEELRGVAYGVFVARKGWLEGGDILNALSAEALLEALRR